MTHFAVNFKETVASQPWEADSPFYVQLLEMTRYFLAWNPLILIVMLLLIQITMKIFAPTHQ